MTGEGIELQMVTNQGVETVEAPPHVARAEAQIHTHTGRQVDHRRMASSTTHKAAASTPLPMRKRSPLFNTSSSATTISALAALEVSSSANRTVSVSCRRLRQ